MSKIILIITIFQLNYNFSQNRKIIIKDSLTHQNISYCNVDYLNGDGGYTNEKGIIEIPLNINKIKLSSVGYSTKIVNLNLEKKDIINLQQEVFELKEVIIKNKYSKIKHYKKMEEHKDFLLSFMPTYLTEIAFFIPFKQNTYLKKIEIPVFKNGHPALGNKKANYNNLIKIEVLNVKDSLPGENLTNYKDTFKISSDSIKNKIEYDFKEEIEIPENGIFIAITFLGKFDIQEGLILELPYYLKEFDGKKLKITKNIEPFFPVFETDKAYTFKRIIFSNNKWEPINQSSIRITGDETKHIFNINIGYELIEKKYY